LFYENEEQKIRVANKDLQCEPWEKVVKPRNDVDHVKDILLSDADLKEFVSHPETAEAWLEILRKAEPTAAGATA